MDENSNRLQDKFLDFIRANLLVVGLFLIGLIFLSIGVIQLLGSNKTEVSFKKGEDLSSKTSKIKVDVEGEVINPGVFELNSDARIQDALIAAGGLTEKANRKTINLAAKLIDGAKIYIPGDAEQVSQALGASTDSNLSSIISINSASSSELESLPGIGPVTAQKIISARPYSSIQELIDKKVVGKSVFEKIKDLVSL